MQDMVPGLERGIKILDLFVTKSEMNLDTITRLTSYPKSSVFRILSTLIGLGLISKNHNNKMYQALAYIAKKENNLSDIFNDSIDFSLKQLSQGLNITAEWFIPTEHGMLLTKQVSSKSTEVLVRAKTGFLRAWDDEFDAIASIAYAFSDYPKENSNLWVYNKKGEISNITSKKFQAIIEQIHNEKSFIDENYNLNGVKRMGAGIFRGGEFVGILSLAMIFVPGLEKTFLEKKKLLKEYVNYIETKKE